LLTEGGDSEPIEVDARGLKCPEPVMLLHSAIRQSPAQGMVRLIATDPSTQRDVPQFCRFLDHTLLTADVDKESQVYSYLIRKQG
jgi:tRNA 2-thiouridine synthesizing protein A